MALQMVLESFSSLDANGQEWRFRPGDLLEDGVAVVAGGPVVPVAALRAQGLAYIPYVAGTMAAMRTAYLADHGQDDAPPSMIPWLVQYAIALSALTPLTGVVNPNGVVTGIFGQTYYDTASDLWYVCHSNPTGTVWDRVPRVITTAGSPNAGAGTAGNVGDVCVDTTNDRTFVNVSGAATGWRPSDDEDQGAVACLLIEQAGVPVAGQLLTIGADVYEADGAGANINFVIGAAEATMDNLLAAAVAHGTEDLFWDKLDATHLRLRSADGPQGTVIAADPNLAVSTNLANYTLSTGTPGNLNTQGGRAAGLSRRSVSVVTVTAAHVAQAEIRFCFPFNVARIGSIQILTATGALTMAGADTFTIANNDVLCTLAGGGGDIAATDIVTVEAWS